MKKVSIFIIINLLFVTHFAFGAEQKQTGRFVNQYQLSTGITVVIAEGDFEPRSIGSYSVRIYGANPMFPTDDFLFGTIRPRDGIIEKVLIQDINGDDIEEIIVILRSVGTGAYLSADAFRYQTKQLKLLVDVTGLKKDADPIRELRRMLEINAKQRKNEND